jgi:hypothetical protein
MQLTNHNGVEDQILAAILLFIIYYQSSLTGKGSCFSDFVIHQIPSSRFRSHLVQSRKSIVTSTLDTLVHVASERVFPFIPIFTYCMITRLGNTYSYVAIEGLLYNLSGKDPILPN